MRFVHSIIGFAISLVLLLLLIILTIRVLLNHPQSWPYIAKQSISTMTPTAAPIIIPPVSLDKIFIADHSWVNRLPPDKKLTVITTGDVIPARTVNFKMTQYHDFTHPFHKTAEMLKSADATLINLEAPLVKNCPVTAEGMIFCGDPRFIEGLEFAGVDIVNLANNHALNYGIEGAGQTVKLLTENGILATGYPSNNLVMKQFNNSYLGFLGFDLLSPFDENELLLTINQSSKKVDLLFVSLHWGTEYTHQPDPWQYALAHRIIDEGATMVVGNHPHWTQPLEVYKDKLIIYAHGNFIFDQEWSEETKTGFIARHTFYENRLVDTEIFPVYISDYNQPELLTGEKKEKILDRLTDISLF